MPAAASAWQTLRCTVALRARGIRTGLITCEGRRPVLHTAGEWRVGRLALRGAQSPVELGALQGAVLEIGDRTFINQGASVVASLSISIGKDVRIGDFVAIYDTDHHPVEEGADVRRAAVVIEDNAWLSRGAIVLPGVTVGAHAVVAAGAVVTTDVAPRTLVAGNPARPLRELRAADGWRRP